MFILDGPFNSPHRALQYSALEDDNLVIGSVLFIVSRGLLLALYGWRDLGSSAFSEEDKG